LKKIIIILIISFPLTCLGKFGWRFADYSILAGQQYYYGQPSLWNLELQYDKYSKSCIHQSHYFGIGLNYSFNTNQKEFGLKFMYNPTRLKIMVSRTFKLYPYLFGQGNFIQTESIAFITNEKMQTSKYSFRPGIGLSGNIRENKILCIRTSIQAGYNIIFNNTQNTKKALTLEFKVGFGINVSKLKRNKQSSEVTPIEVDPNELIVPIK
jgi:hypothetical protein